MRLSVSLTVSLLLDGMEKATLPMFLGLPCLPGALVSRVSLPLHVAVPVQVSLMSASWLR